MYAIVNIVDRKEFEERYHMPFGYGACEVYLDLKDAVSDFRELNEPDTIIEVYDKGFKEEVHGRK